MTKNWEEIILGRLHSIYGDKISHEQKNRFVAFISNNLVNKTKNTRYWSELDIALITYGDSILEKNKKPLTTLHKFINNYLHDTINTIHILPFFPFSSDDGFSVIDFEAVNPELGNWADIENIAGGFKLMVDLVINHVSSKSSWFQNYLKGEGEGNDFFIEESADTDLSQVTRPRNTPLLTRFDTKNGIKNVWTTFSDDQIDLNFGNPEVLYKFLQILHTYINKGAHIIRLDAIAFLWKKVGTTCLHLKQTHEVVKLMHNFVDLTAPGVIILTETNVPNKENISYFGNNDEAHMVYQFSLPPLLLHALNSGNSLYLTKWASSIPELDKDCTYFNFTSSHDGIGVRPLEGLLPDDEKEQLYNDVKLSGGLISTKKNTDGSESAYELNITYFDALKRTRNGEDGWHEQRFLCSQTIMLGMKGMPAFYIHSLLGSSNFYKGVEQTGRARTINREKLNYNKLVKEINEDSTRGRVFNELLNLISLRKKSRAFHPSSKQQIIDLGKNVFAFERIADTGERILAISNVTSQYQQIKINTSFKNYKFDVISQKDVNVKQIELTPYQTLWLTKYGFIDKL